MRSYQFILFAIYTAPVLLFSYDNGLHSELQSPVQKGHPINQYLVKLGWLWTSMPLAILLLYTVYRIHYYFYSEPRQTIAALKIAIIRWLMATFYWILMTQYAPLAGKGGLFHWVLRIHPSAKCSHAVFDSLDDCRKQGHSWMNSFDVSGHVFLLTHASLFIWEELIIAWRFLHLSSYITNTSNGTSNDTINKTEWWLEVAVACMLSVVLGVWYYMLTITCLYYHQWLEKLIASAAALLFWRLTYAGHYYHTHYRHYGLAER